METASVIKRGETCIYTGLHRSLIGLTISVKTVPGVEEFMRRLGGGETVEVNAFGRYWLPEWALSIPPLPTGPPLMAYSVVPLEIMRTDDGPTITIDRLGQPFLHTVDRTEFINLSFLRLVGISEGAGVTFGMKGVYSLDGLRKLKDKLAVAERKFYLEYLRPIDLNVFINTTEVQY